MSTTAQSSLADSANVARLVLRATVDVGRSSPRVSTEDDAAADADGEAGVGAI
jgi:hypothetical protein